jgi:hypothetical protein
MSYGARMNIALAFALAAMLLVAWLMQQDTAPSRPVLAESDFDAVSEIRIELPNRDTLAFGRDGNTWRMRQPLAFDVDAGRLQNIVEALAIPSNARYPAAELELDTLGLGDPPRARLVIDGTEFELGDTNPVTGDRYIRRGEVVHLVSDILYFRLGGPAQGWARRQPLPPGARIARIEAGGFIIVRTEDGWALSPEDEEVPMAALQRVVDAWANAQAVQVAAWDGPQPFENVALVWLDGHTEPLEFVLDPREDMMVLVRPDLELEYRLPLERAEDFWNIPDLQD